MAPPFFPDYHGFGVKIRYKFQGITMEPEDKLIVKNQNIPDANFTADAPKEVKYPLWGKIWEF